MHSLWIILCIFYFQLLVWTIPVSYTPEIPPVHQSLSKRPSRSDSSPFIYTSPDVSSPRASSNTLPENDYSKFSYFKKLLSQLKEKIIKWIHHAKQFLKKTFRNKAYQKAQNEKAEAEILVYAQNPNEYHAMPDTDIQSPRKDVVTVNSQDTNDLHHNSDQDTFGDSGSNSDQSEYPPLLPFSEYNHFWSDNKNQLRQKLSQNEIRLLLKPNEFLGDESLSMYMKILDRIDPDILFILPTFYEIISNKFGDYEFSDLIKNSGEEYSNWISKKKIFIPVNIMQKHWVAVLIDLEKSALLMLDSSSKGNKVEKRVIVDNLNGFIIDLFEHFEKPRPNLKNFDINVPQQSDLVSCGLFVAKFAQDIAIHGYVTREIFNPNRFRKMQFILALIFIAFTFAKNTIKGIVDLTTNELMIKDLKSIDLIMSKSKLKYNNIMKSEIHSVYKKSAKQFKPFAIQYLSKNTLVKRSYEINRLSLSWNTRIQIGIYRAKMKILKYLKSVVNGKQSSQSTENELDKDMEELTVVMRQNGKVWDKISLDLEIYNKQKPEFGNHLPIIEIELNFKALEPRMQEFITEFAKDNSVTLVDSADGLSKWGEIINDYKLKRVGFGGFHKNRPTDVAKMREMIYSNRLHS